MSCFKELDDTTGVIADAASRIALEGNAKHP